MRHGFLLVIKPVGPTSHDVVDAVRRALHERDVGHLGTLDPGASGLLVLAVGRKALKVVELFAGLPKTYEAVVRFGAVTDTYDAQGVMEQVMPKPGWKEPVIEDIRRLITDRFLGSIEQVPPAHSAVHVGGERAYRKARQGKNVVLPSRKVEVTACDVRAYAYPELTLEIACSAGTYIRSLASDMGDILRCGAYLKALRRTKVGQWSIDGAKAPDAALWTDVRSLKEVLEPFGGIEITPGEYEDLRCGRDIAREVKPGTIAWCGGLPVAMLEPKKDGSRKAHPRKVF